jgi:hypothetical protein
MQEEIKLLNQDNYANVLAMLTSNDSGSIRVGYSVLENVDFEESQIFIFCMLNQVNEKVSGFSNTLKEEAPILLEKLNEYGRAIGTDEITLSFRKIYEAAVKRDKKSELLFLINLFSDKLKDVLIEYGFNFMEYFDIVVKPKVSD